MKEFSLYRAHYCGVCRATAELYGQAARLATNYDITFFSLLMHDLTGTEAGFGQKRCVMHAFQKTGNITLNPLLEKIAALNILMAYNNLKDDVVDEGIKKTAPRLLLKGAYKKARKAMPAADASINKHYARLRALERENCGSPDRAADCFASMMRDAGKEVMGAKYFENAGEFLYNLGRWVYLADALDDIDEDFKEKHYNPFLAAYNNYEGRRQFIGANRADICASLYGSIGRMAELLQEFNLTQCQNLLRNIAVYGIRNKTEALLASEKKLPKDRV